MEHKSAPRRIARRDVADRFWEKVNRSTPDACWEWTASRVGNTGYGQFQLDRKILRAHRVAFSLIKGPIPEGGVVMHACDNRLCCNPAHLMLGTQKENLADMTTKGRRVNAPSAGSKNGSAKITEDDVRAIRALAATKRQTQGEIGALFGIDQTTVSLIVNRRKWQHVP